MKTIFCHCILLLNLTLFWHLDLFEIYIVHDVDFVFILTGTGGGLPQGAFKSWFLTGFGAGGRL